MHCRCLPRRAAATFVAPPLLPSSPRGRRCLPCRAAAAAFLPSLSRSRQPLLTRNAQSLPLPALLTRPLTQSSSAADNVAVLPPRRCRCITAAANTLHRCAAHRRRAAAHCPHAADAPPPLPLPPCCRRRQRCAAAKLPPLPPLLTFQLSLTSPFLSPLPLLVDC